MDVAEPLVPGYFVATANMKGFPASPVSTEGATEVAWHQDIKNLNLLMEDGKVDLALENRMAVKCGPTPERFRSDSEPLTGDQSSSLDLIFASSRMTSR
jgi:hypothetical protein